ncbi:AfsR/SARP family transcriptional regulator [Phytomonospora sp. NPDC050363]|uniref:AfsR/SARP family transcriptional regulator n=1 Tax=Phytomonospora sp. NPDC050363 TaxID=3155642 RepID=UPI0033C94479
MPISLIGPVTIDTAGGPVRITASKRACVLALLASRPGVPVSQADLIDGVWDGAPPETVTSALYSYIARLRADLKRAGLAIHRAGSHGYFLDAAPEVVDVHRLRLLAVKAAESGDLALWRQVCDSVRGEVLAGVPGRWAGEFRAAFAQERRGWLDGRYAAELGAGNHAAVVDELAAHVVGESLAEPLVAHLMLALYRSGRSAEALRWFERTRVRLRDEFGADPSPELRDLHVRILGQDPGLVLGSETVAAGPVPAMLPGGIGSFTGREAQLAALSALAGSRAPVLLTGHAGAGKTALAVHWGHAHRSEFPGGCLYINLRGFDRGETVAAREALGRLLLALGVAGDEVPDEVDAAAELFRARTSGRRMLVVLDNAGTAEQVRPLLPGDGCFTVITSRDKLPGLVAVNDVRVVALDVLPREESVLLLRRLLGDEPEREAVDALARLCGDLPLALRVAAANLAGGLRGRIASYVAELEGRDRLALLAVDGDADAAVTAALDHSLATLDADTRGLFARLGAVPGEDFGEELIVTVSGLAPETARRSLRRLATRHLIEQDKPGRHRMHDLVRLHATARASAELTEAQRDEAVEGLIEFHHARRFDEDVDEEINIFAALEALDGHRALWRLVRRLATATNAGRFVTRCRAAAGKAMAQAERDGDDLGVYAMTMLLSSVAAAAGDADACLELQRRAVDLSAGLGPDEQIGSRSGLGLRMADRDHRIAAEWIGRAADLAAAAGHARLQVTNGSNLAYICATLGRFATAARHLDAAEAAAAASGDPVPPERMGNLRVWILLSSWRNDDLLTKAGETRAHALATGNRVIETRVHLYRSIALRRLGRAAEALDEIQACRRILHQEHMVLLRPELELANAYTAIGEPGNALDLLAAVERAWPKTPRLDRADFDLAVARAHLGLGDGDAAEEHATRSASGYGELAAFVRQVEALDVLAEVRSASGREAGAREASAEIARIVGEFEEGWRGPV